MLSPTLSKIYLGAGLLTLSVPYAFSFPANLEERETACIALGTCPSAPSGPPDCAKIEDFTVDAFKAAMLKQPDRDTCLFYTRRTNGETQSLSEKAKNYANCNGRISIWDLWPNSGDKDYYNMNGADSWLRCIHAVDADEKTYFAHMSQAFAESCKGDSLVMTDDPANLPTEGIWPTVELPALRARASEDNGKIQACDVDGGNLHDISNVAKRFFESFKKREDCNWTNPYEPTTEDWFG